MSGIRWDDDELRRNLSATPANLNRAITALVNRRRPMAEAYMRKNAPWTDRTTNARNGLFATSVIEPKKRYALVLAHSQPYGIWLEVRFSGRYAIIMPTVGEQGRGLMDDVNNLLGRMGTG